MTNPAPEKPQPGPSKSTKTARLKWDGREYPLTLEPSGWRLRSKAKGRTVNFRTGTTNLRTALTRAREHMERLASDPIRSRKGGGTLEALAAVYLATPKRTKAAVGRDNISRLRSIARLVTGKELDAVTCREVGPEFWEAYQKKAAAKFGHAYDLATRRPENVRINSATRAARSIFLPRLLTIYRREGLDVRPDAAECQAMPAPWLPHADVDDAALVAAWSQLAEFDPRLWLVIGLARFAGLRREEIASMRGSWLVGATIELRDRPEEGWWTKTGKPYFAQIVEPTLAAGLAGIPAGALVVSDPPDGSDRGRWFERVPQAWLKAHGVADRKPLHRLRGLYADAVATLTRDAVAAHLAGVQAASAALGHTSTATTVAHYLTPK